MALTKEALQGIEALKGLTEDQVSALVTLSTNDENSVIASKVKEIHEAYDADIKAITGRDKPGGKKTYDHLKEVLAEYKTAAENATGGLRKDIEALTKERDDLRQKIESGQIDAAVRKQLEDVRKELLDKTNRIGQLEAKLTEERQTLEKQIEEERSRTVALRVEHEFQKGLTGVKFKDTKLIPEPVRNTYIDHAKQAILSKYKPDWVTQDGREELVFRDEKGMIVNNPKNLQKPFTAAELLLSNVADIIDGGKQQPGAGTQPGGAGGAGGGTGYVDITGARNRTEAVGAIRKHLQTAGVAAGSREFVEQMDKLYQELEVEKLPMK